jgi:RHS repeat-associated protein
MDTKFSYDCSGNRIDRILNVYRGDEDETETEIDGFCGDPERDEEIGLCRHDIRHYDPAAGQWISDEPIAFAGGDPNLVRYPATRSGR